MTQHGGCLVLPACDKRQNLLSVWKWASLKNLDVVSSCVPCGVTTLHVLPCQRRTPSSTLGQFHKDCDLAIISKETWKAEWRHSLELVPLRGHFRQFNIWDAGQDPESWVTCQEVSRKGLRGSPAGSECPALHAAHPPCGTEKHHVPVYLCPVCVQPGFLKSTKHWGTQGSASVWERKTQICGMGEEVSVWGSKQRGWEVSRRQLQAC